MYKVKLFDKLRCLKILPGVLLLISILFTSSNVWLNTEKLAVATICVFSIVFVFSLIAIYLDYSNCDLEGYAACVSHFWWSLLFSSLAFGVSSYRDWAYDDRDRLADMLLMTSTAIKCCCDFVDRFSGNIVYRSVFLLPTEISTLCGFLLGGSIFLDHEHDIDLALIMVASSIVVLNLRMKCSLALLHL
uniref:Transmembrane protein 168 n=1 Tax=Ciona savignyi TaxID=51511 RepID=H2ZB11_CIOSA